MSAINIRSLWLGDLQDWLAGYSAFVRAEALVNSQGFTFGVLDNLWFSTGHAQKILFPGVDAMKLLEDRVRQDQETPPTQEEIVALSCFKEFHRKLLHISEEDISRDLPEVHS